MAAKPDPRFKLVADNRKARFNYAIGEVFEAGIVLTGTEVKSLRERACTLEDAYAKIEGGEVWLIGSDIPEYAMGNRMNHKPKRPRKLLVHRREIDKFAGKATMKGMTLVPLQIYFKDGRAKVEIATARGKARYDKRQAIAARDARRDTERDLKDMQRNR
jgi:SsrA-binding protein